MTGFRVAPIKEIQFKCINQIMKCQVYKSSYIKTVYKIIYNNYF